MGDPVIADRLAACMHCRAACPADPGGAAAFCCAGCRAAHALIVGAGLDGYYRLDAHPGLAPRPAAGESWQDLVRLRADGLAGITWHITGMHCASCLWILERLPALCPGVRMAVANIAEDELRVLFDPARTSADAAARVVTTLGYALHAPAGRAAAARGERRDLLARFAVSAAATMASMHLSLNLYAGDLTRDLDPGSRLGFGIAAGVVALPAALYGGAPFARAAWGGIRAGVIGIDAATTAVVVVGLIASAVGLATGGDLYFDAVAMYITLLLGGRLAMLAARARSLRAIGVQDHLLPRRARVATADGVRDVARADLRPGDRVVVAAGGVVPCDGRADSHAALDVAVMTGESRPAAVAPGSPVAAGSVCLSPTLELTATAVGDDTRIGRLLAQATPRADGSGDGWMGWILAGEFLAAAAVLCWWWPVGPAAAARQAVAVVMVTCPCALGLAAPLARAFACARAGAAGILVRDPGLFARLHRVRHAVFDKTGTLTAGRMRVLDWAWVERDPVRQAAFARAVAAAEAPARHPAAMAIVAAAGREAAMHGSPAADHPAAPDDWQEIPGRGIAWRASIAGAEVALRLGSAAFAAGDDQAPAVPDDGAHTTVHLAAGGHPVARIVLDDPLREDAPALVAVARAQGWTTHVLSGDGAGATAAAAGAVGVRDALGGQSPEDKARALTSLGSCLMLGDGANDAAAMTAATVSLGLRGGLAAMVDSCDAVCVGPADRDRARALRTLIAIAAAERRTRRRLLAFTMLYNLAAIALVAAGYWGPWICALAMPASSLAALGIAALTGRPGREPAPAAMATDLPITDRPLAPAI